MPNKHSTLIGGSSCERVMHCTGSVKLSENMPDSSSSFADEGSMKHSVMEAILEEDKTPEEMIGYEEFGHTLSEEDVQEAIIPALNHFKEVVKKFGAFDYATEARTKFSDLDAFGTVDILGANENYTFIIDWKFGRGVAVSAVDNSQLRFYAGAGRETPEFADMFSRDRKIVLVIIQPNVRDGDPFTYEVIDHDELDIFVNKMKFAVDTVLNGETSLDPGKWCRWCKAAPICNVKQTMAEEILSRNIKDPTIDADEFGRLVRLANEVTDWAKGVHKFAYEELGRGHQVTGYKLVDKLSRRKWRDSDAAEGIFKQLKIAAKDFTKSELISPAQAEKLLKSKKHSFDGLSKLIVSLSSGTTMTDASDKRDAVKPLGASSLNLPSKPNSKG